MESGRLNQVWCYIPECRNLRVPPFGLARAARASSGLVLLFHACPLMRGGQAVLLDLVEQRLVADLQVVGCGLAIPARSLQCLCNRSRLRAALEVPHHELQ